MVNSDYQEWRPGYEPDSESDVASLLQHIRNHNGTVSDEDRKDTTNFGPLSLSIIAELKASKSADVEFLSREIYSSGSRFLYEVIQNADDNRYDRLAGSNEVPQLVITLTKDKLIFENNEDGFSRANVQAISQTRRSTKTTTLDKEQIGEKGIGFKAVFAVADRVHIQSSIYSFSFHYRRGEDEGALGMIAPMKESNKDMPASGTRITLTDFYDIGFDDLRRQLEQLPDPLLLLLRRLRSLIVRIDDGQSVLEISRTRKTIEGSGLTEMLRSSSTKQKEGAAGSVEKLKQSKDMYYVQTRRFDDLPDDPARKVGDTGQFINHAKVMLAFPLDEALLPRIDNQFSYAFLPMRRFGFSFIIQSDFVTQANREDVQYSSRRNRALLDRVGQVFCDAVEEMCKHKSLRYTWMRFLPATISSDFWSSLVSTISHVLQTRSILEPFSNVVPLSASQELIPLCKPGPFCITPSWFLDKDQNPLLPATNQIRYLSLAYSSEDKSKLTSIHVEELNWPRLLDLFKADLDRFDSRWRSLDYDEDWQEQMSKLLISICSNSGCKERLQSFKVVKLLDGEWIAPSSRMFLYMPTTGRADVPSDIGLCVVDPVSVKASGRASFMESLGVKHATPSMVIERIEAKHSTHSPFETIRKGLIHFLYLFWHGPEEFNPSLKTKLQFVREPGIRTHLNIDVFVPLAGNDLGPEQLFKKTSQGPVQADGFSQALFLHHIWLEDDMVDSLATNSRGETWEDWLVLTVDLLDRPRLLTSGFGGADYISTEFKEQKDWMLVAPSFVLQFSTMNVLCQGDTLVYLSKSILPTANLRRLASSFGVPDLPFILLQDDVQDNKLHEWTFLRQFNVVTDEGLDFYIKCIIQANRSSGECSEEDIFGIYRETMGSCKRDDIGRLEKQLDSHKWIRIPATDNMNPVWVSTKDCRWKGPSWLTYKHVLSKIEQYKNLEFLLHTILQLPDATGTDFIEQLKDMKTGSSNSINIDTVKAIYELLWSESRKDTQSWLKAQFETHALIWTGSTWLGPSQCVWAPDKMKIEGKVSIQDVWGAEASLVSMFTKGLEIPIPSLEMHIASLVSLEKSHGSTADIINVMEHIASLRRPEGELKSKLERLNIFPIKQGSKEIRTSLGTEFVIIDQSSYRGDFEGKIHILDFNDHDIWRTKDFLIACGLRNQFISECSTEKTSAANAVLYKSKTENLRAKAYAFLRYAKHCRSTRAQDSHDELYENLQNMSVFKSDDIRRSRSITQSSQTHTISLNKVGIHIDESASLKIYVPADPADFERCWPIDIILKLKKWLEVSDKTFDDVLVQIFHRNNLVLLDEDLEKRSIITVDGVERPQGIVSLAVTSDDDVRSTASYASANSRFNTTAASSYWSRTNSQSSSHENGPDTYGEILEEVIRAAQSKSVHDQNNPQTPRSITSNNQRLQSAFGPAFINGARNIQHDRKINAAGELFIFEFLKKRRLPNFDLKNWKSTIRHEVRVHNDYRGLSAFSSRETGDIVYQDTSGALTKILCDSHYLDQAVWLNERPEYLIMVKTTTEACEDPFYVSAAQYKLMNDSRLVEGRANSQVYLILRVFNLGQADAIDYRIYLDPWSAKERGELQLSADNWKVEPTRFTERGAIPSSSPAPNTLGESIRLSSPSTQSLSTSISPKVSDQQPPQTSTTPVSGSNPSSFAAFLSSLTPLSGGFSPAIVASQLPTQTTTSLFEQGNARQHSSGITTSLFELGDASQAFSQKKARPSGPNVASQTPPQTTTSLQGSSIAGQQSSQTTTSLFGSSITSQTPPQTTVNWFGQSSAGQRPLPTTINWFGRGDASQQPSRTTTSLSGSSIADQPFSRTTGVLFGSSTTSQQIPRTTTSSSGSGAGSQQPSQATTSLFKSSIPSQQSPGMAPSFSGSSVTTQQPSRSTTSSFGASDARSLSRSISGTQESSKTTTSSSSSGASVAIQQPAQTTSSFSGSTVVTQQPPRTSTALSGASIASQRPPQTITIPFVATKLKEDSTVVDYQSITHEPEFQKWSFEELRLNDGYPPAP